MVNICLVDHYLWDKGIEFEVTSFYLGYLFYDMFMADM